MADAKRSYIPNIRLRAVRDARSESRREFARALRRQAQAMGENIACDEQRVARWERGEVRWPRSVYRRVLAALLGVPVEQLGFQPPEPSYETPAVGGETPPSLPSIARPRATLTPADLWTDWQTPGRARGPMAPMFGPALDLTPGTLESLEMAVDDLCRDYGRKPVREVAVLAQKRHALVTRMLEDGMRPAARRRLLVVAGWTSAVLGCLQFDMGQRHRAETHRQAVLDFAAESGNPAELTAWAWEMATWFAIVEGRFADALGYARAGQTATGDSPVAARLALHEAKAAARLRDRRRAEDALDRAHAIVGRSPWSFDEDHHFAMDEVRVLAHAATAHLWLGDDAAAEDCAWQVLVHQLTPSGMTKHPMRIAETRITIGIIAARREDLEQAVYFGKAALGAERVSFPTLLARAAELEAVLMAGFHGSRPSVEFREQLREFQQRWTGPTEGRRRA